MKKSSLNLKRIFIGTYNECFYHFVTLGRHMKIKFVAKQQVNDFTWQFEFKPSGQYFYFPGQYASFDFRHLTHPITREPRYFSLTSHPSEANLQFLTHIHAGLSDYKTQLSQLEKGDVIEIGEAIGDFVLPRQQDLPLVCIAGGLGAASFISLFKDIALSGRSHNIHWYWALRGRAYKFPIKSFEKLSNTTSFLAIAPKRIDIEKILNEVPARSLFYVSGSQTFTDSIVSKLHSHMINDSRIIFDYFTGYSEL